MKKHLFAAMTLLCISGTVVAQEKQNDEPRKIELVVTAKLGFAKLDFGGGPKLNGSMLGNDILLAFPLGSSLTISGGVGLYEFDANTTVAGENASFNSNFLRIPVLLTGDYSMHKNNSGSEKIFFTIAGGPYANTILSQKFETFDGNSKIRNQGWNFGINLQVGAKFILNDNLNIGIGMDSQTDLTKAKKNGVSQKIEQFNGMYFRLGFVL